MQMVAYKGTGTVIIFNISTFEYYHNKLTLYIADLADIRLYCNISKFLPIIVLNKKVIDFYSHLPS